MAKIGNAANLFDRLNFQGGEALNREEAAQLCLNTLKATMVEYTGGFNVTAGDATVVGAMTRSYVTSNQEYARYINNRKVVNLNAQTNTTLDVYTVEFGEEHFKDLRLNDEHKTEVDAFGRPSNVWSWKKVTIGVFPIAPDFEYTEQMAVWSDKPSNASKVRALGLNGYKVNDKLDTEVYVNGKLYSINDVADIADFTDYGTLVQVYVSEDFADNISHVVVIHTMLTQVKKVGAEAVSLKLYKDSGSDGWIDGFNQEPIDQNEITSSKLNDVEVDDERFEFFSGRKADDIVAVIPVADDSTDANTTYSVYAAYIPETVTGALTNSRTYANSAVSDEDRGVVEVTMGGTAYKVANWNKNLQDINRSVLKITTKDVTLHLDEYGNALLAIDVGSTNSYMILGAWRNQLANGTIVAMAEGWDIKGNPVSLNVGAESSMIVDGYKKNFKPGDVLHYTNDGATGAAEWVVDKYGVHDIPGNAKATSTNNYRIQANNSTIKLGDSLFPEAGYVGSKVSLKTAMDGHTQPKINDGGVNTIYVNIDKTTDEVDYIEVKSGLQNITEKELRCDEGTYTDGKSRTHAEATVTLSKDVMTAKSEISAVVVKVESSDASLKNLGYVYDTSTYNEKATKDNEVITDYKVLTYTGETVIMRSTNHIGNRVFVRYTELEDGMYRLIAYKKNDIARFGTNTAMLTDATILSTVTEKQNNDNMYLLKDNYTTDDVSASDKM